MKLDASFMVFSIVVVVAIFASFLLLGNSVVGLAQFSVGRCSLADGFEKDFSSKNDCESALNSLCPQVCSASLRDCIDVSKRACKNIGRADVRFFR